MTERADEDVPWLVGAQLEDWKAVMALVTVLPAAMDAQLKRDSGVNLYEYQVLAALSARPHGELPMSDLARLSGGSPSRLSHAVSRLEDLGWVTRGSCTEAGKRTSARLTPAGREKLRATAPGHVREVRRLVVDVLGPEGFAALARAGRAVTQVAAPDVAAILAAPVPTARG
ncbi:MarR family winged helix-turn-helix transcriptional regulator [Cellulomonas sp. NPDC057328]|uniref:MarR family winged helix-turn-helix transcriptional regulator n=1 Tax=Cellulomonas sp. NPDC057328 TaxID=3346101 RepID=UPI00363C443B